MTSAYRDAANRTDMHIARLEGLADTLVVLADANPYLGGSDRRANMIVTVLGLLSNEVRRNSQVAHGRVGGQRREGGMNEMQAFELVK